MDARIAKEEIALLLPNSLTRTRSAAAPRSPRSGWSQRLAGALAWFAQARQRRVVLNELGMLNDRELADIGLGRTELHRVFDADFAARRDAVQTVHRFSHRG